MKILLVHNFYQHRGGEDIVFELEADLLESHGHTIRKLTFDNKEIISLKDKIVAGLFSCYNPKSARIIKEEILDFKPEIVHVHNFFPLVSPSIFYVAKSQGVSVVVTLHNFRIICPNATMFRKEHICESCIKKIVPFAAVRNRCYRDSLVQTLPLVVMISSHKILKTWQKKVDKFIVLTQFQKEKFLDSAIKFDTEKVVVKPNFSKDHGVGFKKRENFYLYVGRLSEEKGIKTLLESTRYLNFNLKIVGDGVLKKEVLKYSNNKNIEYLGFKDKREIINLMKRAKALILPSVCYEGFPMVIVEAFSTGTPVITSDLGGQASIVKDMKTGIHFEAGNPRGLADKIRLFEQVNNTLFYENARKEYLERYTPSKNYELLIKIYREVKDASSKEGIRY